MHEIEQTSSYGKRIRPAGKTGLPASSHGSFSRSHNWSSSLPRPEPDAGSTSGPALLTTRPRALRQLTWTTGVQTWTGAGTVTGGTTGGTGTGVETVGVGGVGSGLLGVGCLGGAAGGRVGVEDAGGAGRLGAAGAWGRDGCGVTDGRRGCVVVPEPSEPFEEPPLGDEPVPLGDEPDDELSLVSGRSLGRSRAPRMLPRSARRQAGSATQARSALLAAAAS